jgi:Leucine-rich repeat (LRR) protein
MNNLTELPDQVGALTHLVGLELSDNRLAALPPAITKVRQTGPPGPGEEGPLPVV